MIAEQSQWKFISAMAVAKSIAVMTTIVLCFLLIAG